jgi:hypothetical protein
MKLIKQTKDYTIYQKRSGRYGVQNASKKWVNADEKVKILSKEKLIKLSAAAPKKEEPAEEAPAQE